MADRQEGPTGGGRLAHSFYWSLLGNAAPLFVAIVAIPILIDGLGIARFGVLTLAWIVVGYFSLFDLGLGRALTKLVAEKLGHRQNQEIPGLVWTAMSLMMFLGVFGAGIVAVLSPWLVGSALKIPPELTQETLNAFFLLAISIPIVIGTTGLRGVLEAYQRFGLVNAVRIPLGILTFLGPVAVLPFSRNLVPVVAVLVFTRLLSWFAYAAMCFHVEPALRHSIQFQRKLINPLINLGGWMTVTNIIGPLMVYMDRLLIGTAVSITAVAYYATPYEIVTKLWIVSGALMSVMFPAFAAALTVDRVRAIHLFNRSVKYIFLLLFPVSLVIVTLAPEGLRLWLGSEFAGNSTLVLQVLTVGVFINSLAQVPFGMLQAYGRPDLTAKLHIIELPFYLVLLWWALGNYGIVGAAIAWLVRVAIDTILMFIFAHHSLSIESPFSFRSTFVASISLFLFVAGALIKAIMMKGVFLFFVPGLFYAAGWFLLLEDDEKRYLRNKFNCFRPMVGE